MLKAPMAEVQQDEARSTRDEILDAAERLFAERGFAGVSMRDIVRETNLRNQASLYHHFENKRALYEAVLARGLSYVFETMPPRPSRNFEELSRNMDRLLDYLWQHPHLARLIQRSALDDAPHLDSTLSRLLQPFSSYESTALAGASQIWNRKDIPHLGAGLYLLIFGYFANAPLLAHMLREDPLSQGAVEHQRRFIKEAVARLLGIKPADGRASKGGA